MLLFGKQAVWWLPTTSDTDTLILSDKICDRIVWSVFIMLSGRKSPISTDVDFFGKSLIIENWAWSFVSLILLNSSVSNGAKKSIFDFYNLAVRPSGPGTLTWLSLDIALLTSYSVLFSLKTDEFRKSTGTYFSMYDAWMSTILSGVVPLERLKMFSFDVFSYHFWI